MSNQNEQDRQRVLEDLLAENQQLKERQDKLVSKIRLFLTSLPFGLIIAKKNQRIKALNDIAATYFEYSADELNKQLVSVVFPEVEFFEVTQKPMRLIARKKSGEDFATEVFVNSLEIDGEEMLFISVQDISEKHRLEQLRQDLIAMVSHDLRAPLTSIRVTLEMVNEGTYGNLSERGNGLVLQGISSVEYLNSLVGNLLESEKAESGSIELDYRETTIGAIVEKAINAVWVPEREATVNVESDFTNDAINVDPERIMQVLINLISNAIKYSPADSKVTVLAGIEGVNAKFQVIDRGPGIPEKLQPLIFQRFRQLEQPGHKKRMGFGLGLAICKALVEKHRGRIWVESAENKGSRFCFTVPISPNK